MGILEERAGCFRSRRWESDVSDPVVSAWVARAQVWLVPCPGHEAELQPGLLRQDMGIQPSLRGLQEAWPDGQLLHEV